MNLFKWLKNNFFDKKVKVSSNNNFELAFEICSKFNIVSNNKPLSCKSNGIIKNSANRIDLLNTVIDLLPNPKTNEEFYLLAMACVYMGATGRERAIYYLNKFIENGAWCRFFENINYPYHKDTAIAQKADAYSYLGKSYEGEYMIEKSIEAYKSAYNLEPYLAYHSVYLANAYVKNRQYEKALDVLEEAKKYCDADKSELGVILTCERDILYKKERGYIYKPRPNHPLRQ